MNKVPLPKIATSRLILRKARMSDLENYHQRLTSDPSVAKHMLCDACPDIHHTRSTIQRILDGYKKGTRYHWAIALKEDDSLIGTIALLAFDEAANSCSFAYMLSKAFWGMGYGTEALNAVLQFAFENLKIDLVVADHFEENTASGTVMERAGMVKTTILPNRYLKNEKYFNAVQYQIKNPDFFKNNP